VVTTIDWQEGRREGRRREARRAIFTVIKARYDPARLHAACGYRSAMNHQSDGYEDARTDRQSTRPANRAPPQDKPKPKVVRSQTLDTMLSYGTHATEGD